MCSCSITLQHLHELGIGQSRRSKSLWGVCRYKVTDLVFADDAVLLAESLDVLVMALEALHEEAKPLGLEVSWTKTKVQTFGGLLGNTVQSVHACGEEIEVLESFTYLGSVVHNNGGSGQEVT